MSLRRVQDLDERSEIVSNDNLSAWLDRTPAQAASWIDDTFQARLTAGDTQVQACLFILRRIARLLLIVARHGGLR